MSAHAAHWSLTVLIRSSSLVVLALACTFGLGMSAQDVPQTPLSKQLSRMDLGVSAAGVFNHLVSGAVVPPNASNYPGVVSISPSNTVGATANLRYVAKPYIGVEFNWLHARYTENYSHTPFGVQTAADEFTLGYVVTPAHLIFGAQPYASVGAGTTKFTPTRGGGQGLTTQARATYYYSVGLQEDLLHNFGARVGLRQAFYLDPDYGQNYLTILQHSYTIEPTIGFYLRF